MAQERIEVADPQVVLESFSALGPDEAKLVGFFRSQVSDSFKGFTQEASDGTRIQTVIGHTTVEGFPGETPWISLIHASNVNSLGVSFADSQKAFGGAVGRRVDISLSHFSRGNDSLDGEPVLIREPSSDKLLINLPFGKWVLDRERELAEMFPYSPPNLA